jgi:hypothetical protein
MENMMNLLKKLFLVTAVMSLGTVAIYADNPDGKTVFEREIEENNENLLNFINSKRTIPLADKSKNLSVAGEVHFEWNYQTEKIKGKNVRVFTFREPEAWDEEVFITNDTIAIGRSDFDVQLDIFVDWKSDRTWARSHLRYDNSSGVSDNGVDQQIDPQGYHGSGSINSLALREAYIGYEIFKNDNERLTIELGRRGNIYKAFYSEIQFSSRLDGVILKLASKRGGHVFADWYITLAGLVVDERATQYAYVTEIGLGNILDSGIDFKYSFIDWQKNGGNRFFRKNPLGFRYKVSQVSLLYSFAPSWSDGQEISLAAAFLMNHIPARYTYININPNPGGYYGKKVKIGTQNLGCFVNIKYREIAHEGDWFVSGLAGFCQAQCIPDNDVRNIGTGNALHESMTSDGRGNTNWKGYCLTAGYAITDNLVLETQYNHSWNAINISGSQGFSRFTMETTYSF